MRNWAALILFTVILTGCSALGGLIPTPGVNANAQIGKENTQQVVGQQNTTDVAGDMTTTNTQVSSGSVGNVKIENIPPWAIILLILGWVLPNPTDMWRDWMSSRKKKNKKA